MLKCMAYQSLLRGDTALVFIEPAGDASKQIAKWREHNTADRLIYVDHSLKLGMTPCINPFEIYGIDAKDTSPPALNAKKVVAQQLLSAFQEVIATGQGSDLTRNMQTVLMQCILVLLDYPGATIRDLLRFANDTANADLVAFAETRTHYPDVRDFFTHGFYRKTLQPTREAIQNRLQVLRFTVR
jgi:hypothetical protein